jgi:periplasmic protein TonB
MVSGHAVVRLPVSSLIALAVMACVFQFLYSTVMKPQLVTVATIKPIEFTPLIIDHPARPKPPIKEPQPPKHVDPPATPRADGPPGVWDGPTVIPPTVIDPPQTTSQGRISGIAQPIVRIEPEYPRRAQESGIEGWVQVQFTVNAAGTVTDVLVVDADPKGVFDAAATKAVQHWKYAPKVDDGRAVEMRGVQVILRFDLKNER